MVKLIRGLFRAGCSQMAKHRLPESGDGEALRHLQGQVFQSVGGDADGVIFFGGGVAGVGDVTAGLGAGGYENGFVGVFAGVGLAQGSGLAGFGVDGYDGAVADLGGGDPAGRGQGYQQRGGEIAGARPQAPA